MTANTTEHILAQLRQAKEQTPELGDFLDLHAELLAAGALTAVPLAGPEITAEEARACWVAGLPLLRPHELPLDWEAVWRLYAQVCHVAAQHRPDLAAECAELLALRQRAPDTLHASLMQYLAEGRLDDRAEAEAQQQQLLAFVFNHTVRPFLRAYAARLAPLLAHELWQRGRCPICGGAPDFGYLEEKTGARYLVCARCDTRWLFPRVKCPFCSTGEPADLQYYLSEDGRYRLYTCLACRRYLKTIDLRQAGTHGVLVEVARIITVDLDAAAVEEGFG